MEGGVHDARRYTIGHQAAQGSLPRATSKTNPVAIFKTAVFRIVRMNFQSIFFMPGHIRCAAGLCSYIVLAEYAAGGEQKRKTRTGSLICGDVFGQNELASAIYELVHVHDRRACRGLVIAGPLKRPQLVKLFIAHARESRCCSRDLIHYL